MGLHLMGFGIGKLITCEEQMNSARYIVIMEEVLEQSILKLLEDDHPNVYFHQNNASYHHAKATVSILSCHP